jgi:lipoprotein-releasing system ATP-binding protein
MNEGLLQVRGLSKSYPSGPRLIEVLKDLDLAVAASETLAVVGDSGVGKSTLLHLLGGLDRPDSGRVQFRGREIFDGDARQLAAYRTHHVGFVFQFHHLLPEFTALENVELPFRIGRRADADADRPRRLLERLGLGERLAHRPGELSGGEQQRVAIARAVALGPELVLADEPTGNLDPRTGRKVFDVLCALQREFGFALILASHNERLARSCGRVLRLEDGLLRAMGEQETREYFDA